MNIQDYKPPFNWTCPNCGRLTTITKSNITAHALELWCEVTPEKKSIRIEALLIECPNDKCHEQFFRIDAFHGERLRPPSGGYIHVQPDIKRPVGIGSVVYYPASAAPLSPYIPEQIKADYTEAYLIRTLSPKASATLARRALQGMIRDFWGIKKSTLHAEIEAIKDKCDEGIYSAMMGLKSIGNIGAHPERDINQIADVDPGEPEALLNLIHLLDQDWYIARAERQRRVDLVKAIAESKRSPQP